MILMIGNILVYVLPEVPSIISSEAGIKVLG